MSREIVAAFLEAEDLAGGVRDLSHAIELDPRLAGAYRSRARRGRVAATTAAPCPTTTVRSSSSRLAPWPTSTGPLELEPGDATTYFWRGELRAAQGDVPGALSDLRTFCERAPKHREVPAARKRIAELEAKQ
jgi:hypothetical protein